MAYGGVEVYFHSFLTSAPREDAWLALRPGRFTPCKNTGIHCMGVWVDTRAGLEVTKKSEVFPQWRGIENTFIQQHCNCTDRANRNTLCLQQVVSKVHTAATNRSHIRLKLSGVGRRTQLEAGIYVLNIPLRHSTGWNVEDDRFLSFQLTNTITNGVTAGSVRRTGANVKALCCQVLHDTSNSTAVWTFLGLARLSFG